jgi:glutathione synthase/RimK-type ligase-like ATP-grasp enzyme
VILIITNRQDYTADYLILGLRELGVDFVRFNTEEFPEQVGLTLSFSNSGSSGSLDFRGRQIDTREVTSVWYRRPVSSVPSHKIRDEAARQFAVQESNTALQGLWRTLDSFWVSHPDNIRYAESKIHQLAIAGKCGFLVPATLITTSPKAAFNFYEEFSSELVYKPLEHSKITRGDRISLIYTNRLDEKLADRFDSVAAAPTLLQQHIKKKVEIRVTVVGRQAMAAEIHSQVHPESIDDWRRIDPRKMTHAPHLLPAGIEKSCIELVSRLGLQFGAIDLIITPDDEYFFLEINPNGQWAWIQQICPEIKIREALIDLLVKPMVKYTVT